MVSVISEYREAADEQQHSWKHPKVCNRWPSDLVRWFKKISNVPLNKLCFGMDRKNDSNLPTTLGPTAGLFSNYCSFAIRRRKTWQSAESLDSGAEIGRNWEKVPEHVRWTYDEVSWLSSRTRRLFLKIVNVILTASKVSWIFARFPGWNTAHVRCWEFTDLDIKIVLEGIECVLTSTS